MHSLSEGARAVLRAEKYGLHQSAAGCLLICCLPAANVDSGVNGQPLESNLQSTDAIACNDNRVGRMSPMKDSLLQATYRLCPLDD